MPILIDYTVAPQTFTYASTPSITAAGGYGKFTTNPGGVFGGFFGFVHTGNGWFTAGNHVMPSIALAVDGETTVSNRFAADSSITVLQFAAGNGPNDGTFIKGNSLTGSGKIIFLYDKDGSDSTVFGRPLTITLSENVNVITGNGATSWGTGFISGYNYAAGSWNTIIPNVTSNGVRLIVSKAIGFLPQQFCDFDSDGIWPGSGTNTVNPNGGVIIPLQLTVADAPLNSLNCALAVPVTLGIFNVQKIKNAVKIVWTTEQEINSSHFIIQRSPDTGTWKDIYTITAAGNSQAKINYAVTDYTPQKGINYYRLKQVDADGKFDYSEIKTILFSNNFDVTVNPNPVKDFINIYVSKEFNSPVLILVMDAHGNILQKLNTTEASVKINTSRLGKGIYIIKVIEGATMIVKQVVVI